MQRRLLPLLITLALAAGGCAAGKKPEEPSVVPPHEPGTKVIAIQTEPIPVSKQLEGQTGVVRVIVTDEGFQPSTLTATVGGKVKIHLQNRGTKAHNLILERFRVITSSLPPGGENYIEFTPDEKGEWPFISDASGEAEPGISGILKVE